MRDAASTDIHTHIMYHTDSAGSHTHVSAVLPPRTLSMRAQAHLPVPAQFHVNAQLHLSCTADCVSFTHFKAAPGRVVSSADGEPGVRV